MREIAPDSLKETHSVRRACVAPGAQGATSMAHAAASVVPGRARRPRSPWAVSSVRLKGRNSCSRGPCERSALPSFRRVAKGRAASRTPGRFPTTRPAEKLTRSHACDPFWTAGESSLWPNSRCVLAWSSSLLRWRSAQTSRRTVASADGASSRIGTLRTDGLASERRGRRRGAAVPCGREPP
jgi:hypothetical protein